MTSNDSWIVLCRYSIAHLNLNYDWRDKTQKINSEEVGDYQVSYFLRLLIEISTALIVLSGLLPTQSLFNLSINEKSICQCMNIFQDFEAQRSISNFFIIIFQP